MSKRRKDMTANPPAAGALPPELQAMIDHVSACESDFRPSAFWEHFDQQNVRQLLSAGVDNFKRTINQNYYNWLPTSPADNQFRALLRLTADLPTVEAFMAELDADDAAVESLFSSDGLSSRPAAEIYRLFVGMLWAYTSQVSPNGLTSALEEPALGNPIPLRLGGRRISQDLANSIRERNAVLSMVEPELREGRAQTIVEIGAGYGRLAHVIMSSAPCRYVIVDIPPALYVSQWYLTQLFSNKCTFKFRAWRDWDEVAAELTASELVFLTPDQFAKLPDRSFDIAIAISNLAEMTPRQVSKYIELFDKKVRNFVYIKQWISSDNALDLCHYEKADFDMPQGWSKSFDRADAVQDFFFETLWRRT
ncbi:putative sugar O-methyltransferase [Phenylobacterium sp. LjRoot225]|uniref:putative sugar O-methyltransferase n=1 Tax=Phenylobacterium sp. LjRoot225 TaxID=3342285 RepID=UPI003ECD4794